MTVSKGVKLVLREHVDNLGERGEVVAVKPGYARNFLIPKGMAYEATPGYMKMVEHQRRTWAQRDAKETEAAKALAADLDKVELSVKKKAGENGTLYGSVTKAELVELLKAKGFEVDRKAIGPDDPIKTVGEFPITVKVYRDVKAELKLTVESDSPAPVEAEPVAESEFAIDDDE